MTLKCDKDLISNPTNSGCGEWDAGANLRMHHHTGEYDSVQQTLGRYLVNGAYPDTFDYVNGPLYNYYESYEKFRTITQVNSETQATIGNGNNAMTLSDKDRGMFLWLADELKNAGLTAGNIHQLAFDIDITNTSSLGLTISYTQTSDDEITSVDNSALREVASGTYTFGATGYHDIVLTEPIYWDGSSNLLIEFKLEKNSGSLVVKSDTTTFNSSASAKSHEGYLELTGSEYAVAQMNDYQFGDEITIAFWASGSADDLPAQTTIFSCANKFGQNIASGHIGHNENIRWDSGSEGKTNRCQRAGTESHYEGGWNHWAFTKNVKTGFTKIYFNGALFYQDKDHTIPLGEIHRLLIGSHINFDINRPYFGKIDDFSMWRTELDANTIEEWMNKDIQSSHPNYDDLVVYYTFDEPYIIEDHSGNGFDAMATSSAIHKTMAAADLFRNIQLHNERPNMRFSQGDYVFQTDSTLILDSVLLPPSQVVEYGTGDRKFIVSNIKNLWEPQKTYVYNANGQVKQTIDNSVENTIYKEDLIYYEEPFEVTIAWTMGHYITPYGNYLDLGDGFTWVWDVSEFEQFLKDSVDIEAGSHREIMDLRFVMIEGPPPATLKVSRIWENNSGNYADLANDVSRQATEQILDENTKHLFLRSALGGHKHASDNGEYPHCCEWKNNEHYLYANGDLADTWHVWKNCGWTALFPQGGTWNGAREGWCPGDVRDFHYTRLTDFILSDNTITIDYDITPVPADNQGMGRGGYSSSWFLLQYGDPTFDIDAEVVRVMAPSDWDIYKRMNPICREAKVIIKNNGDEPLTSVTVTYGVQGGEQLTYNWKGNLLFKDVDTLLLPVDNGAFYEGDGSNNFIVSLSKPNGKDDEFTQNDSYTSHFELPDMFNHKIIIDFKTNNYPQQNRYYVLNGLGYKVFERTNMQANTRYQDEINTYGGCYTLVVEDDANDGLEYWANPPQGNGYVFLRKADNNKLIKAFDSDFGSGINYAFSIGGMNYIKDPNLEGVMEVYPNPTSNIVQVELGGATEGSTIVLYNSVGKVVYQRDLQEEDRDFSIDLSNNDPGVYMLNWISDGDIISKQIVVSR